MSTRVVIEPDEPEDGDLFLGIARYDWYISEDSDLLHYADPGQFSDDDRRDIGNEWCVSSPARLACGETAEGLWIPGLFTRMGTERCTGCCRALGYPPGKGSPKNDETCRVILGLSGSHSADPLIADCFFASAPEEGPHLEDR